MGRSHPKCWTGDGYAHEVCRKPSGRPCVEPGCDDDAGTLWGPLWCPTHDVERLDRVSKGFEGIRAAFDRNAAED